MVHVGSKLLLSTLSLVNEKRHNLHKGALIYYEVGGYEFEEEDNPIFCDPTYEIKSLFRKLLRNDIFQ